MPSLLTSKMEAPKYGVTVIGLTIVCCKTAMLTAQSSFAALIAAAFITAIGRTFKVLPLAKLIGQPKYWPDNHTGAANKRPLTFTTMENQYYTHGPNCAYIVRPDGTAVYYADRPSLKEQEVHSYRTDVLKDLNTLEPCSQETFLEIKWRVIRKMQEGGAI